MNKKKWLNESVLLCFALACMLLCFALACSYVLVRMVECNEGIQDIKDKMEDNEEIMDNEPTVAPSIEPFNDYYFCEKDISTNASVAITYNGSVIAYVNLTFECELFEVMSSFDNESGTYNPATGYISGIYEVKLHIVNLYLNITVTGADFYGGLCLSIVELIYVSTSTTQPSTVISEILMDNLNIEQWGDYAELEQWSE